MKDVKDLLNSLSIKAKNIEYYLVALTHSSANADRSYTHSDYERLEFLGDSVVSFVSADLIYKLHPEMDQGLMSKLRSYLVCSKSLANYSRSMNLQDYVTVGNSVSKEQLLNSDKILEDVFESFVGAIYLDLGLEVAYKFVESYLYDDIENTGIDALIDPKTRLQEDIQAEFRDSVKYKVIDEQGPPHDRTFTVQVSFNDVVLGTGVGKSKKAAEEAAAKDALSKRVF